MVSTVYEHWADGSDPRLLDSIVAFLDVLGTASAMDETDPVDLETRFASFRNAWAEAEKNAELRPGDPDAWLGVATFSDSLVVANVVGPCDDTEHPLGTVVDAAAQFQLSLALHGLFARGGISRGPVWISRTLAYGPGLVRAYRTESKYAVYPRMILGPNVASDVRTHVDYSDAGESWADWHLLVDAGGTVFVNYLAYAGDWTKPLSVVERHREAVTAALFDSRGMAKVEDKFHWLARYHNFVVDTVFDGQPKLRVEVASPQTWFRRPSDWATSTA